MSQVMRNNVYQYSNHAVRQMFQRGISTHEIEFVIEQGEIIKSYPDDQPFPSNLSLGWINHRPIHVVYSINEVEKVVIVITAYEPSPDLWEEGFRTKKTKS